MSDAPKAALSLEANFALLVRALCRIAHALEFLADRTSSGYFRKESGEPLNS